MDIMRINVSCGQTPTKGWRNFDNSLSLCLSKFPFLPELLYKLRLLEKSQYKFIQFCRLNHIEYGDATKGLPVVNRSIDVFYSSHMIEHLDQADAYKFLKEARRVLCSGGIIRLVVPDLRKLIEKYIESRDADEFILSTFLCKPRPRTIAQRLKVMVAGDRNHRWMYDGESLCRLLTSLGFVNASIMPPGKTKIQNPEPLDLREREAESVYVEAENQ
jgi:predicted SAM-dependent methyltransferase